MYKRVHQQVQPSPQHGPERCAARGVRWRYHASVGPYTEGEGRTNIRRWHSRGRGYRRDVPSTFRHRTYGRERLLESSVPRGSQIYRLLPREGYQRDLPSMSRHRTSSSGQLLPARVRGGSGIIQTRAGASLAPSHAQAGEHGCHRRWGQRREDRGSGAGRGPPGDDGIGTRQGLTRRGGAPHGPRLGEPREVPGPPLGPFYPQKL